MEDAIITALAREGFPVFVAAYLLLRLQKSLDAIGSELAQISRAMRRLDDITDEREAKRAYARV